MPKIIYQDTRFTKPSLQLILQADSIIQEYMAQQLHLTLRQLYYQFVARDLLPNVQSQYKRLGRIISTARRAGYIDWEAIVDRTRERHLNSHWESPGNILQSVASQYAIDKWADQPYRIEVWVEKDAAIGVIEPVCAWLDVPFLSCRGYISEPVLWETAQRFRKYVAGGQEVVVLHLADHDASGVDMTDDIGKRLGLFMEDAADSATLHRVALTMDQVIKFGPPPNPAKESDTRYQAYVEKYGVETWELDALDPATLAKLIEDTVLEYRHEKLWKDACQREEKGQKDLQLLHESWDVVRKSLKGNASSKEKTSTKGKNPARKKPRNKGR